MYIHMHTHIPIHYIYIFIFIFPRNIQCPGTNQPSTLFFWIPEVSSKWWLRHEAGGIRHVQGHRSHGQRGLCDWWIRRKGESNKNIQGLYANVDAGFLAFGDQFYPVFTSRDINKWFDARIMRWIVDMTRGFTILSPFAANRFFWYLAQAYLETRSTHFARPLHDERSRSSFERSGSMINMVHPDFYVLWNTNS